MLEEAGQHRSHQWRRRRRCHGDHGSADRCHHRCRRTGRSGDGGVGLSLRRHRPAGRQGWGEPGGNIRVGFLFRTDRGWLCRQTRRHRHQRGRRGHDRCAGEPDPAASVLQPGTHPGRYLRSGARQSLRWDSQTAGRGVHLQRPHALRHRQPLELQAGRRAALRPEPAAGAGQRGQAGQPGHARAPLRR